VFPSEYNDTHVHRLLKNSVCHCTTEQKLQAISEDNIIEKRMESNLLLSWKNQPGKESQINQRIFIQFFAIFIQQRLMILELKFHSRKT
jgi:hypothetical protein